MDALSTSIRRCWYLCRWTKIRILKSLVIPVLLCGCETWTLNTDLKSRIYAFAGPCDTAGITVSNQRLLRETDSKLITSIVHRVGEATRPLAYAPHDWWWLNSIHLSVTVRTILVHREWCFHRCIWWLQPGSHPRTRPNTPALWCQVTVSLLTYHLSISGQ